VIAIFPTLGWQEMFLLLVIGLLLYGRNLPDAGRSLGRIVAQLKRSFHDFKDQIDRDGELRDVKKTLQDTAREVKNVAKVPRAMSNPSDALRELTHEAMSSPVDEPQARAGDDAPSSAPSSPTAGS
jgi:Sec-independent protein translocase protein TatA